MIIQEFYIPKYGDWHVKVYYAARHKWEYYKNSTVYI